MRKNPKLRVLRGSVILLALLASPALTEAADEPFIGPYLQALKRDSVIIKWETEAKSLGEVEVGEGDSFSRTLRENDPRSLHEVPIDGLRTDTLYAYRVKWEGKTSDTFRFRTMPPEGCRHFRLVAYGDSRTNPAIHVEIVRRILTYDPDFIIHTGDIVLEGAKKEQWKPQFFDPARPLIARKPLISALGNHEGSASTYFQYFNYPNNESWYSYRWANAQFISLDTQKPYDPKSEQYRWLQKELDGPDPDWRVVFCHYPMFSCHPTREINNNRWAWQDLFDKHGVDFVITGHDHYYHRTHRIGRAWDSKSEGVYHITTAGGGAPLYPVEEKIYTAKAMSMHHFTVLDFDGKVVKGTIVGVDGKILDTFTIDRTHREETPFVSYEMILWEKALKEAVEKIEPKWISEKEGRVEEHFKLPAFEGGIASVSYRWVGGSSYWATGLCDGTVEVNRKEPFEVGLYGEGRTHSMYPLPELELSFNKGTGGYRDFSNKTIRVQPLHVTANLVLNARKLRGPIYIDGKMDEPAWQGGTEVGGFSQDSGRVLSNREALVVGYDDAGIYVGAKIRSRLEKPLEAGSKDHDASKLYRTDESVTVVFTLPSLLAADFLFSANSRGTRYDALNGVQSWNPEWEFKAAEMPGGWQAEMKIPWKAFAFKAPPVGSWRVNFLRWDAVEKRLSEWVPTYSITGETRKYDGRITFERPQSGD